MNDKGFMNKGEVVKFFNLQIGDYFSDNARQKYRKIPQFDLALPNLPSMVINAFHIQSNTIASLKPNDEFVFIAHAAWNPEEHKEQFMFPVEVAELDHQIEFFTNYFEILNTSLQSIETSDDFLDGESFGSQEVGEFVNVMRSSFFVSLYSYLEAKLNNECRNSQQDNSQIKVLLDDIHGAGINRAKTYLVKVLDTSFPFGNDTNWEQILWFNKIRNCIVHNEGKVRDKDLKRYLEAHPNLHYEMFFGDDYVILDDGFCENAIIVIGAFLKSLLHHQQADKIY